METILGIGLIAYSAYQFFNMGTAETNLIWWAQSAGSGVIGLVYLVYSNIGNLLSYLPKSTKIEKQSTVFELSDSEIFTLTSLAHLRSRLESKNDTEGLDHLAKINDILFNEGRRNKTEVVKG